MQATRFHIGKSTVGNDRLDDAPWEAHVTWIEDGQEVSTDFGEQDLVDEIAWWEAAGHDASLHRRALVALRDAGGEVRFHIGKTIVGSQRSSDVPWKAFVTWEERGRHRAADLDEAALSHKIAQWDAIGRETSVLRQALVRLCGSEPPARTGAS